MKRKTSTSQLSNISSLMIILFVLVVLTFFVSFRNKETKPFKNPVIIGNTDTNAVCLSPIYMLNAWYDIERLDDISDTLDLSKPGKSQEGLSYYFIMPYSKRNRSNHALRVFVDTVNELTMTKKPIWASYLFHRSFSDKSEIRQDDTLIQQVKSFPIYLCNLSETDTANIELQDGSVMMVVQAIDKNGQWKDIEYWSNSWCGNSYSSFMIPARQLIMTRGIKCSGDFQTSCRMKVSNRKETIFSNEFVMSINETQFERPVRKDR